MLKLNEHLSPKVEKNLFTFSISLLGESLGSLTLHTNPNFNSGPRDRSFFANPSNFSSGIMPLVKIVTKKPRMFK